MPVLADPYTIITFVWFDCWFFFFAVDVCSLFRATTTTCAGRGGDEEIDGPCFRVLR